MSARGLDVLVVGAGAAGLYALHRLRGLGFDVLAVERGPSVGGTWYWNRYPGARCDVESFDYSYSFDEALQQEWTWSERYASQPEILAYLEHVADRFELRRDIRLNTTVTGARWDEAASRWRVETEEGAAFSPRWLVMATGVLSTPKIPDLPGLDGFRGEVVNSANWPEGGVDFAGRRVAVVGTGSSGIQIVPIAAEQADRLFVLQRTPSFSVPARNRAWTAEEDAAVKADYPRFRRRARSSVLGAYIETIGKNASEVDEETRRAEFQKVYDYGSTMRYANTFDDIITDQAANDAAADFLRETIRAKVVDPATAERLVPHGDPLATRRLCADTGYYESFNRDDVELVDLREEPLETVTEHGLRTARREIGLDLLVLATGFDAVTGTISRLDIRGVDGTTIGEKWGHAPSSLLGLAVAGFPNLFTITGPTSPSVLSNMFVAIEQHVEFVADLLAHARSLGASRVEASVEAEDAWVRHAAEVADGTLFRKASSWYVGRNVPGKPRVLLQYVGGVGAYQERLDRIAAAGFTGFDFGGVESARVPSTEGAIA